MEDRKKNTTSKGGWRYCLSNRKMALKRALAIIRCCLFALPPFHFFLIRNNKYLPLCETIVKRLDSSISAVPPFLPVKTPYEGEERGSLFYWEETTFSRKGARRSTIYYFPREFYENTDRDEDLLWCTLWLDNCFSKLPF